MSLTTYEDIKAQVRDELEQLEETPYPEDLLYQFADSEVPIYYGDIVEEWQQLPFDDTDRWQELGANPETTIYKLMQIDLLLYYERQFVEAWEAVKEE
jgi:hypothetical protein